MIFVNTSFAGHYPVGTSAVVCATSKEEAAQILQRTLKHKGLSQEVLPEHMVKFMAVPGNCSILNDGDY